MNKNFRIPHAFSLPICLLLALLLWAPMKVPAQHWQKEIDSLNTVIANLKEDNNNLNMYLRTCQRLVESEEGRTKNLVAKHDSLITSGMAKDRKLGEIRGLLRDSQNEVSALLSKIDRRKKLRDSLKSELKKIELLAEENKTLRSEKDKLEGIIEHVSKERDTHWEQYQAKKNALETSEAKRTAIESELQATKRDFEAYKKSVLGIKAFISQEIIAVKTEVTKLYQGDILKVKECSLLQLEQRIASLMQLSDQNQKVQVQKFERRYKRYYQFWQIMKQAQLAIERDFEPIKVQEAYRYLKQVETTGFSDNLLENRKNRMALLRKYCSEYKRVRDVFETINGMETQPENFITNMLVRLQNGVDPSYLYIRVQIQKRIDNPSQKDQPFKKFSNCPPLDD